MKTEDLTTQLAKHILRRIADGCRDNYGAKARLKERYDAATGKDTERSNFTRWLAVDTDLFMEPALGTAMLLWHCFQAEQAEQGKEKEPMWVAMLASAILGERKTVTVCGQRLDGKKLAALIAGYYVTAKNLKRTA